ncbi:MAG: hypothetical protein WBD40_25505 [Tepidisphaeraceae bacterium]
MRATDADDRRTLIAIFDTKADVEDAFTRYAAAGLDTDGISVVGRAYHIDEQLCGFACGVGGQDDYAGRDADFWNALWRALPGAAFLWVPRIGPLVFAGSFLADVRGASHSIELAAPISPVGDALLALGAPLDVAGNCESALRADRLLFVARAEPHDVASTYVLLGQSRSLEVRVFAARPPRGGGAHATGEVQ